jgi:hypothetical protein
VQLRLDMAAWEVWRMNFTLTLATGSFTAMTGPRRRINDRS